MKVNIGKNTLGDNDKMSLSLREYGRSTHNLSYAWRSTMGVGTLVPFMKFLALPGDTFEINLQNKILTNPTVGPLYGSYKFQADLFSCPIRLYNAMLHNNALNIGMDMSKVKIPTMHLRGYQGDVTDVQDVNSSNLLFYMGVKGCPAGLDKRFNAVPILAYYDIFKNYYANKQEKKFPRIDTNGAVNIIDENTNLNINWVADSEKTLFSASKTLTFGVKSSKDITDLTKEVLKCKLQWEQKGEIVSAVIGDYNAEQTDFAIVKKGNNYMVTLAPKLTVMTPETLFKVYNGSFNTGEWKGEAKYDISKNILWENLEIIDELREYILSQGKKDVFFGFKGEGEEGDSEEFLSDNKANQFIAILGRKEYRQTPLGGLCLKTHMSDIFNNWINEEWVTGENGIEKITAIDTSSGSFTIDTLNLAKKVYEMLNRIAVSGGSYKDWIETVYTTDYYFRAETPVYEGGMSSEIEFEEIVSNSASEANGNEPLGTLAGRGVNTSMKGGNIIIKVNEPCYIIGIASITPRVDYSQGNDWDMYLRTLDELHKPQLDGIGYQDLIATRMDWRAREVHAIGKQPAWINYMTNFNKTAGEFAVGGSQSFMVLNRMYNTPSLNEGIQNASTYILPQDYNQVFAEQSVLSQNFWVQIGARVEARRVMTAKQIPNF